MNRRSFLKGLGLLTGTFAAAVNGVRLVSDTAKIKFQEWGMIRTGDVFTISEAYVINGNSQTFTIINKTSGNLDELNHYKNNNA
jgi:hypothetical protein